MGNQLSNACSLQSLERLDLSPQERENLNLYLWRSSSETNMYIPKVKFNAEEELLFKNQTSICQNEKNTQISNLIFEDFICDFRQLKSFLNVSEILTVFKMVLKGHETIFKKFNASIVSEKCTFVTPDGEIRVWINPNYYLNEFCTVESERKEARSKTEFLQTHKLSNLTPRFLNREEYESKSASLIMSESVLLRKIVQLVFQTSQNSEEVFKLKSFIENEMNLQRVNECKFSTLHFLIEEYATANKIIIRETIEEAVKRLIAEGHIFNTKKCSLKSLKQTRKTMNTMETKPNSAIIKYNLVGRESNLISILDLKSLSPEKSKNKQAFKKTNNEISVTQKERVETLETENEFDYFKKRSVVEKNNQEHRRKLSKSLIQQKCSNEMENSQPFERISMDLCFKKKENQLKDLPEVEKKEKSLKKLDYSFQYSINLYTNQASNPTPINSQFKSNEFACQTERPYHHHQNSSGQLENLKESVSSKPSSILKKGNTKSFDVSKSFNGFLNAISMENKKKKILFEEPSKFNHLSDVKNNKQLCISPFLMENCCDKTIEKTKFSENKENQVSDETIGDLDETKKTTIKNKKSENGNRWSIQEQKPFEEITKQQIFMEEFEEENKLLTKKIVNPHCKFETNHRGQTSMLIKLKNADKLHDEVIIKSKRRISVGGNEVDNEIKMIGLEAKKNKFGFESARNNENQENQTSKTITRLLSSENVIEASIGSFSSISESEKGSEVSRYTGILTKMGRSVPFKHVSDDYVKEILEGSECRSPNRADLCKKKRTTFDLGNNRSVKM